MGPLIEGDDNLSATEVGEWAKQKHEYLRRYLDISSATRKKFLDGKSNSATFIDLFCGPGRARIKETGEWIDGSAIAAWKISQEGGAPFSELFVADIDDASRLATAQRLKRLGAPVQELPGSAIEAAARVVQSVNPYGLHFAFIDPFSLGALDFQIIESLASLKRIDMLIHVSKMDHQRNLGINITSEESAFDSFVPGWRDKIDLNRSQQEIRRLVVEYWRDKVAELGIGPSPEMRLIKGSRNQHLYWLLLAAKHELAHKFWKVAAGTDPQGRLFD
jgi:three-Cys-motif partner protein